MPELPEVESVCRGLRAAQINSPIVDVWRSPQHLRVGAAWRRDREALEQLMGSRPGQVDRRGKHILWNMFSPNIRKRKGKEDCTLLIHLGMSGRCGVSAVDAPVVVHTHLRLRFKQGLELRFVDPRRFGGLRVGPRTEIYTSSPVGLLGPEPLSSDFDGAHLHARLGRSTRVLRDALLDQRVVAGIGNIYAIEALFAARIHPLLRCDRLTLTAWQRLANALRQVLEQGIANGGTTLKDFRNVTGKVGRNQDDLRVYGRAGQPCPSCTKELVAFVSGGRGGVFCPAEQKIPRGKKAVS